MVQGKILIKVILMMVASQINYLASKYMLFIITQKKKDKISIYFSPTISQALTAMAALGKITSSERNKSSADVLDKHPDAFSQPNPNEHQPRLVKRDGTSSLVNNRSYYNPPRKVKSRPTSAVKEQTKKQEVVADENKKKEDEQLALRLVNRTFKIKLTNIDISFEMLHLFYLCSIRRVR